MKHWSIITTNACNCSFESFNSNLSPNIHLFIIPQLNCVCYVIPALSSFVHPSCLKQATHYCLHRQWVKVLYTTDILGVARLCCSLKKSLFPAKHKNKPRSWKSNKAKPKTTVKVCFCSCGLCHHQKCFPSVAQHFNYARDAPSACLKGQWPNSSRAWTHILHFLSPKWGRNFPIWPGAVFIYVSGEGSFVCL